jgi:hypothetical protein
MYYHSLLLVAKCSYKNIAKIGNRVVRKPGHVIINIGMYQRFEMGTYLCSKVAERERVRTYFYPPLGGCRKAKSSLGDSG